MDWSDQIIQALATRFGYEVVNKDIRPNQLRLLGRVPQAHGRNWFVGRKHLLRVSSKQDWSLDSSKVDVLRSDDEMVWGFRLIFQHEDMEAQTPNILQAIAGAPRAKVEVDEQVLSVQGQRTMMNARGKGATAVGQPPMLIRMRGGMG